MPMKQKILKNLKFVLVGLGLLAIVIFFGYKRYQMMDKAEYSVNFDSVYSYNIGNNRKHSKLFNKDGKPFFWFGYMPQSSGGAPRSYAFHPEYTYDTWDIPARVELLLYSSTDDQFYELKTDLPYEQIKAMFKETVPQIMYADKYFPLKTGRRYEHLVFWFAPKGKIYLYISGYEARLIGIYQATPIDYDWWQDTLEDATYPPEIEALQRGERCYQTYATKGTDICYEIADRETSARNYKLGKEYKDFQEKAHLYYNEGFFDPVQVHFKLTGRNAKLLAYQAKLLNAEEFIIHKPEEHTEPFKSIPVVFVLRFVIDDKPYELFLNLSGDMFGIGGSDRSSEYYQYWQDNFDMSKPVEIEIELVDDESLNVWFKQGDKKLLSEVAYVEELDVF
ncbi:hypothetical protein DQF64_12275 [Moraxella bovis]|nr:hypothetical protein DQF64_12275 [Moraxella bovis]